MPKVISDPPNNSNIKSDAWGNWLAELRNYLESIGVTIPPGKFGSGVTSQVWVDYAAKVSNAISGAPPVPMGVPPTSPIWGTWYTEIANLLNQ